MRQLIGKRFTSEDIPRTRHQSIVSSPSMTRRSSSPALADKTYQAIEDLASQVESELSIAIKNQNALHSDNVSLVMQLKQVDSFVH